MSIFLFVLKTIGIILLSIIALLIIAIVLVLFVPIRYRIIASKSEESDFYAEIKLTWLLHFINILAKYTDGLYYRVRITLIPIKKSQNLKKQSKKKDNNDKALQENTDGLNNEELNNTTELLQDSPDFNELKILNAEGINENISNDNVSDDNEDSLNFTDNDESNEDTIDTDENKGIFYKIRFVLTKFIEFLFNIKDKLIIAYDTAVNIYNDIEYYIDAINDERNRKVFSLCLSQSSNIINNIKPRVFKGNLTIGLDEPYTMGQILSIYGILFPIIHDKITINPVYDKELIEGDLLIKGRVRVFILIKAAIKIYFNRDFKRMMRIFKKES